MSEHRVTTRYAKSLLTLSQDQGVLEKVNEDIRLFSEVCKTTREFTLMLKNPIISQEKKSKVLEEIFEGKIHKITAAFFDIIMRKNREMFLPGIARDFQYQYNVLHGISMAEVTTVFPLDESLRNQFRNLISRITDKPGVELEEETDENLVGGFVLRLGDRQMDQSLKGKLKELELKFS